MSKPYPNRIFGAGPILPRSEPVVSSLLMGCAQKELNLQPASSGADSRGVEPAVGASIQDATSRFPRRQDESAESNRHQSVTAPDGFRGSAHKAVGAGAAYGNSADTHTSPPGSQTDDASVSGVAAPSPQPRRADLWDCRFCGPTKKLCETCRDGGYPASTPSGYALSSRPAKPFSGTSGLFARPLGGDA